MLDTSRNIQKKIRIKSESVEMNVSVIKWNITKAIKVGLSLLVDVEVSFDTMVWNWQVEIAL